MLRRSFLQLVGLATGTVGLLVSDPPCPPRNPHCAPAPTTSTTSTSTSTSTSTTLPEPVGEGDLFHDAYG